MRHDLITTDDDLKRLCRELAGSRRIAFDTEFISERSYRPQLCLVQVAVAGRVAVIDPVAVKDLQPFWDALASGEHETIVHAGREEVNFCRRHTGRPPSGLIDLQIAGALVTTEYPAGYGALINRMLGKKLHKHETRTDWSRRPLTRKQIDYAVEDVSFLEPLWEAVAERLNRLGRTAWLAEEMRDWQQELEQSATAERWRRVSGISGLDPKSLAIVRELWQWREREAERRDQPPRRVLRDDLIVEIARRQTADVGQINIIRGLDRGDLKRFLPQLSQAVQQALTSSERMQRSAPRRELPPQINLVAQLLAPVLTSICRSAEVAAGLVGTMQDLRDLIAHHTGLERNPGGELPLLMHGWRAEIVGKVIEDLIDGKTWLRIVDPLAEAPLGIEPANPGHAARPPAR